MKTVPVLTEKQPQLFLYQNRPHALTGKPRSDPTRKTLMLRWKHLPRALNEHTVNQVSTRHLRRGLTDNKIDYVKTVPTTKSATSICRPYIRRTNPLLQRHDNTAYRAPTMIWITYTGSKTVRKPGHKKPLAYPTTGTR